MPSCREETVEEEQVEEQRRRDGRCRRARAMLLPMGGDPCRNLPRS